MSSPPNKTVTLIVSVKNVKKKKTKNVTLRTTELINNIGLNSVKKYIFLKPGNNVSVGNFNLFAKNDSL